MKSEAYIKHILDAIQAIEDFTKGISYKEFIQNKEKYSAVIRQFEIIGEAINQLEKSLAEEKMSLKDKEIPLESIVEMRNILIHEYFAVDLSLIWDTIEEDLPILKEKIANLSRL
jgi:uncharacterized protein with HEPN domain